jgi:methylmalonyl-CoA/ethylmalonyl-CoA epimerase
MAIVKFDHISLLVQDLDAAISHYDRLFRFDKRQMIIERDYKDTNPNTGEVDVLHFLLAPVGQVWLELMEPVRPDGAMMKHLNSHGEGFHHVGITSDDVVDEWKFHDGIRDEVGVIERCPRVDQYKVSYWFLHPKKNFGALWEVDAAWAKTSASDMTPIEPTPDWKSILES